MMVPQLASILLLAAALLFDVTERRIPDALTYTATLLGIAYWISLGYFGVIFHTLATFLGAYILYRLGLWAGGDVKLLTALAALNPYYVTVFGKQIPFTLAILVAALFSALFFTIPYLLWRVVRTPSLRGKIESDIPFILRRSLVIAAAIPVFGPLSALPLLLPFPGDIFSAVALILWNPQISLIKTFVAVFVAGLIIRLLWMRGEVFRRVKRIDELEVGDVPADFILEDGRTVQFSWRTAVFAEMGRIKVKYSPLRAAGLEEEDIQWLREKGVERLAVRTTTPFVPFLAAGYILILGLQYFGV